MIDIHTHILPGIDDGAADMYDTLEMAQIAVTSGVKGIVATPHCNIPGLYKNYYSEAFAELFRETESILEGEGISLTLYAGMEVFLDENVPRLLRDGKILTINGSRNLLVEFDFEEDPDYAKKMLQQIKECRVRPVIAHPERYRFVQDNPQIVYDWREKGYLVQVNKGSIQGKFGRRARKTAKRLLNHNLISVIASDAHSPYQRTPWMKDVYEELLEIYPEKYLKILFEENPRRICEDQPTFRFQARPFGEE